MKLVSKLTLFIFLSKLVIAGVFVIVLPMLVEQVAFQYTNQLLHKKKNNALEEIKRNGIEYYLEGETAYGSYTLLKDEYIALMADPDTAVSDTIVTAPRIVDTDTLTYRILTHHFEVEEEWYVMEIGRTLEAIQQYNQPLQRVALFILGLLIVATLLADLFYTRFLLRPLQVIIQSKLHHARFPFREIPPPVQTGTEDFRYLDRTLMELMGKVNAAFEKERAFTSNASHELLTPVSILQSKMENMMLEEGLAEEQQERLAGMMRTLHRLKKIVQLLLLLARIENEQYLKGEVVPVNKVLKEVTAELEMALEENVIQLKTDVPDTVLLRNGNTHLIFQLLFNLLHNAIRHNVQNGTVNVSWTHTGSDTKFIADRFPREDLQEFQGMLEIRNTGEGVGEGELPFIFERFRKSSRSGEGLGLGLAIVKAIAEYHGIPITADSDNSDFSIFLLLPL